MGSVFIYDCKQDEFVLYASNFSHHLRVPFGKGIATCVFQDQDLLNIENCYEDSRFDQRTDVKTGYKTTSLVCAAIIDPEGASVGVIQALNKLPPGKNGEKAFLKAIAFVRKDEKALLAMSKYFGKLISKHTEINKSMLGKVMTDTATIRTGGTKARELEKEADEPASPISPAPLSPSIDSADMDNVPDSAEDMELSGSVDDLDDDDDDGSKCHICMEEPIQVEYHPCRHQLVCSGCAPIPGQLCQLCATRVEYVSNITVLPTMDAHQNASGFGMAGARRVNARNAPMPPTIESPVSSIEPPSPTSMGSRRQSTISIAGPMDPPRRPSMVSTPGAPPGQPPCLSEESQRPSHGELLS